MSLSTFRPLGGLGLVVSTALALPSAESNPSLTHDPVVRLVDLSLNVMTAAGASTASDGEIEELQAGHHDPKRRGFTFQNAELAIAGAVDPYFTAQAYIVAGEEGFELEEAFAETSSLPQGLQVRAGYFYTEIGRTNPSHPHSSPWLTRPVVITRFFGEEGTRSSGARLSWLAPTPVYLRFLVSAQDAANETATSFRGLADEDDDTVTIAGRSRSDFEVRNPGDLLWLARVENGLDLGEWALQIGASALVGPNGTGEDAATTIAGIDGKLKWTASGATRGYPFLTIEGEALWRTFEAEEDTVNTLPATDLEDRGAFLSVLYGFRPDWAIGIRGEVASGEGDDPASDRQRDDRLRIAPVLTWSPTHFSRLRLEYDYDSFDVPLADGDDHAHSIWLGLEVLIGTHPAHGF